MGQLSSRQRAAAAGGWLRRGPRAAPRLAWWKLCARRCQRACGCAWWEPGLATRMGSPPTGEGGETKRLMRAGGGVWACLGRTGPAGTGQGAGSGALHTEWAILCAVVTILCHLPAHQLQLWHIIDHSTNSVMCYSSFHRAPQTFSQHTRAP